MQSAHAGCQVERLRGEGLCSLLVQPPLELKLSVAELEQCALLLGCAPGNPPGNSPGNPPGDPPGGLIRTGAGGPRCPCKCASGSAPVAFSGAPASGKSNRVGGGPRTRDGLTGAGAGAFRGCAGLGGRSARARKSRQHPPRTHTTRTPHHGHPSRLVI